MNDTRTLSRSADGNNFPLKGDALAIFARAPIPGAVKTRLAAAIGAEAAALLYAAMLQDCLTLAQHIVPENVVVCFSPSDAFATDDEYSLAGFWSGARLPQCSGDLGDRLSNCFGQLQQSGAAKIVVLGSDAPDLPPEYLSRALALLDAHDLVLGPAHDGGFYLLGARSLPQGLFENVPWSSESTLAAVLENAARSEAGVALLEPWRDVDEIEDLRALGERLISGRSTAPQTARVLRSQHLL